MASCLLAKREEDEIQKKNSKKKNRHYNYFAVLYLSYHYTLAAGIATVIDVKRYI
jgi:hypothetical protein